jgi:hypothetical protein
MFKVYSLVHANFMVQLIVYKQLFWTIVAKKSPGANRGF